MVVVGSVFHGTTVVVLFNFLDKCFKFLVVKVVTRRREDEMFAFFVCVLTYPGFVKSLDRFQTQSNLSSPFAKVMSAPNRL